LNIWRFIKLLKSVKAKYGSDYRLLIFMPLLFTSLSHSETQQSCGNNPEAIKLAKLIINDESQNRKSLKCNSILSKIADKKAKEMAKLGRVTHIGRNPANRRLRDEGYPLSDVYPGWFSSKSR